MYFHTNSSSIHSDVRLSVLVNSLLNGALHKHSENVKTVQVSGYFGIIRSAESPLIMVLLNTGTGGKAMVPKNNKRYPLKEQVNLYSNLEKNHWHGM